MTTPQSEVTIGIPVYNEESNIVELLESIMTQDNLTIKIVKVILFDDGSTDRSVSRIQKWMSRNTELNIELIQNGENKGKSHGLSQIIKKTHSDFLLLLDSDISFNADNTIHDLFMGAKNARAGLTNGWYTYGDSSNTPIARALKFSSDFLIQVSRAKPLFSSWGGIMLLDKDVYSTLVMPDGLYRIDAWIYLHTRSIGRPYLFMSDVVVNDSKDLNSIDRRWFRKVQSRSQDYPIVLSKQFGSLRNELNATRLEILIALAHTFLRHPLNMAFYSYFKMDSFIWNKYLSGKQVGTKHLWRS